MQIEKMMVRMCFTEPVLGSASGNKEIHEEFVASKGLTDSKAREELDALEVTEEIQKSSTIFPRDDQGLFLWDYQLRGFLKESIAALIELGDVDLSKWSYKRAVDSFVFVSPRRVYLFDARGMHYKTAPDTLQRPLRADTMQGPRVCLARSESLPPGTSCEFTVEILTGSGRLKRTKGEVSRVKSDVASIRREDIIAALDYGRLKGFGQWRSGGYGRFDWSEVVQQPAAGAPDGYSRSAREKAAA